MSRAGSRTRMAANDAAWLHMDRRTNRSIVTSVMWLDADLDESTFAAVVAERIVDRFPRFSQRAVDRTTSVWWEDVPEFDLSGHLHPAWLEPPGDRAQLQRFVSSLLGRSLDRSRPLWEMHLVHGYGGGCAIIGRVHHCIADGVALSRLMLSLTDDPDYSAAAGLAERGPAGGLAAQAGHWAASAVHAGLRPLATARSVVAAGRSGITLAGLPPDHRSPLRGAVGSGKSTIWSDPFPLAGLRGAAHANEVTINDLVLAAMCGALRSHLARAGATVRDLRAVVPVNLRPADRPLPVELGNAFGLVYVSLPLHLDDPLERLREVQRRTSRVKRTADAFVSYRLLGLLGRLPYEAEQLAVGLFAAKASVVVTNVAGPRTAVHLAGSRVGGTIGWPPESGDLGLGLSVISYAGGVVIGALADDRLVPQPERIVEDTVRGLDDLIGPGAR